MIARCATLSQALDEIEAGALAGASTIVISRRAWDALSSNERDLYRTRAERAGIELHADEAISSHFVEVRGGEEAPPLSSERHV
ncbi:MAG TPA: hypothetical protein VN719_03625 [Gemmatimonadales bacterium]|jgi:hypothetical protein|nr:hypothetical protein [Gemmatimonadales bacterium]